MNIVACAISSIYTSNCGMQAPDQRLSDAQLASLRMQDAAIHAICATSRSTIAPAICEYCLTATAGSHCSGCGAPHHLNATPTGELP